MINSKPKNQVSDRFWLKDTCVHLCRPGSKDLSGASCNRHSSHPPKNLFFCSKYYGSWSQNDCNGEQWEPLVKSRMEASESVFWTYLTEQHSYPIVTFLMSNFFFAPHWLLFMFAINVFPPWRHFYHHMAQLYSLSYLRHFHNGISHIHPFYSTMRAISNL